MRKDLRGGGFKGADGGGADGDDGRFVGAGGSKQFDGLDGDVVLLDVHAVCFESIGFYREKGTEADIKLNGSAADAGGFELLEKGRGEV